MMNILPSLEPKRKWLAILLTIAIAGLLTIWGIFGIDQYGIALFVLTPLFLGAGPIFIYGHKNQIGRKEAIKLSFTTLALFSVGLIIFGIEGLICIAMAAPFGILLTWMGSLMAFRMINKSSNSTPEAMIILIAAIPLTAFVEKENTPSLTSVTTSIEIDAPAEIVWQNVIQFPLLDKPSEFLFKTGIAYPINATIDGKGVGAVRHCNFTTGSFIEPITAWDEPKLLRFSVAQQPAPMVELSFWNINSPHLHDYFVSRQGQFKLTALPGGHTLLEGTTWYYHNIKPEFYWKLWSNYIIHKIHERVLLNIKQSSEKIT